MVKPSESETGRFAVEWHGTGETAQHPANPAYPHGMDVDLSFGAPMTCRMELTYPAEGVGGWLLTCRLCAIRVGVTAAGRADDPRSVVVACRPMAGMGRPI